MEGQVQGLEEELKQKARSADKYFLLALASVYMTTDWLLRVSTCLLIGCCQYLHGSPQTCSAAKEEAGSDSLEGVQ